MTPTIRGPRWFLPLLDRDAGRAVRPELDVAPCQGGGLQRLRPPSASTPMIARSTVARAWATATDSMWPRGRAGAALPARPRPVQPGVPGPELLSPAVAGAVSAGRLDATRKAYSGSSVSSWPRPAMPASSGCRLHRWKSPNTSRPWRGIIALWK